MTSLLFWLNLRFTTSFVSSVAIKSAARSFSVTARRWPAADGCCWHTCTLQSEGVFTSPRLKPWHGVCLPPGRCCNYHINPLNACEHMYDLCIDFSSFTQWRKNKNKIAALFFFFLSILVIFPSSLTRQLPYFVILWSLAGGNFCAGYDLKMLANQKVPLKLEQDVTKDPGPMVSRARALFMCEVRTKTRKPG